MYFGKVNTAIMDYVLRMLGVFTNVIFNKLINKSSPGYKSYKRITPLVDDMIADLILVMCSDEVKLQTDNCTENIVCPVKV